MQLWAYFAALFDVVADVSAATIALVLVEPRPTALAAQPAAPVTEVVTKPEDTQVLEASQLTGAASK